MYSPTTLCKITDSAQVTPEKTILDDFVDESFASYNNECGSDSPTSCEITDSAQATPEKPILDDFDYKSSVSYNNECGTDHSYKLLNRNLCNERRLFFDFTNGD